MTRTNPKALDDILPGEFMPGIPERGSDAETALIDAVTAERPWRGPWHWFFTLLRRCGFTAYVLMVGLKFGIPSPAYWALVVLGILTDFRLGKAPDLSLPAKTYITHVLRQVSIWPVRKESGRRRRIPTFVWGHIAFLMIMPVAIYHSHQLVNLCSDENRFSVVLCAGSQTFLDLGRTFCVLATFFLWARTARYMFDSMMVMPLSGALAKTFWKVNKNQITIIPFGYYGPISRFILFLAWLLLMLILLVLPTMPPLEDWIFPAHSLTFFKAVEVFLWWMFYANLYFFLPIGAYFVFRWNAQGAAIAASIRVRLTERRLTSPEN